jgi:hypothetical protein
MGMHIHSRTHTHTSHCTTCRLISFSSPHAAGLTVDDGGDAGAFWLESPESPGRADSIASTPMLIPCLCVCVCVCVFECVREWPSLPHSFSRRLPPLRRSRELVAPIASARDEKVAHLPWFTLRRPSTPVCPKCIVLAHTLRERALKPNMMCSCAAYHALRSRYGCDHVVVNAQTAEACLSCLQLRK